MIAHTMAKVCLGGVIAAVMSAGCEKASAGPEKTKAAAGEKTKAAGKAQTGFSFAVYGDSRSMMYLPYKKDEEAEERGLGAA